MSESDPVINPEVTATPEEATQDTASFDPATLIPYGLFALKMVAPLIAVYFLYQLGKYLYAFAMTQWVQGGANEWVVIMRDGEQRHAGIGLSCFKSPFDQVAIFPSQLVKLDVKSQQCTKEMQGIEVSSHVEWTVDRNAPLKAYKYLNLGSGNCNAANDIMRSMAAAIIRNQVANSTIDHIIKNRQLLREEVLREMSEIVSGWGVHLATVEVTDVKILSSSLFKDMQTKFREENVKKATLEKMVVENCIYFQTLEKELEKAKRDANTQKVREDAQHKQELTKTRHNIVEYKKKCELRQKEIIRNNDQYLRSGENQLTLQLKSFERSIENKKAEIDKSIKEEESNRLFNDQNESTTRLEQGDRLKQAKLKNDAALALKQTEYDLLKECFQDPVVSKLEYMKVIGDIYSSVKFNQFHINQMGDTDPVAQIVSKFLTMAQIEQ